MGRYRKIDTRIWNDAKFRAMSDQAKLAFLFVLTHPHLTSLGAMRATLDGLAAELGWTAKAFREAFREALAKGIAEHDEKASFIGLPNFLRYNGPESPNVVKSWSEALDLIPECNLKTVLLKRVKGFAEGLSKAFAEALPEAFAKDMPNQEQEQEQDIEAKASCAEAAKPHSPPPSAFTFPTRGKVRRWNLPEAKLAEYLESFPGMDVAAELRKALQWCRDNGEKQKTAKGMPAFLGRWLAKAANSGHASNGKSNGKAANGHTRPLEPHEFDKWDPYSPTGMRDE